MAARNPTREEVEALREKKGVEARPVSKITHVTPNKDNMIGEVTLKPKKSNWEPDPYPFKLPSLNKVIKENLTEECEIFIRRIGTADENIYKELIKQEDRGVLGFFEMIDKFLFSCVKSNIDVDDLAYPDKMAAFLFLLKISYGNDHDLEIMCPACFKKTKQKISIEDDVAIKYFDDEISNPTRIEMNSFGTPYAFWFKLFTIGEERFFMRDDVLLEDQMARVIIRIDGQKEDGSLIDKKDYVEMCSNLNLEDRKKFRKFIANYTSYGTDLNISNFKCMNKECTKHKEDQRVILPFDKILVNANA